MAHSKTIYLGIKGSVIAMEAASGRALWKVELKGGEFVSVVLDGDHLYATTRGEIFCLDPLTGQVRWHNPLKGYGWGLITIAGANIPSMLLPLLEEKARRDQAAAASNSSAS